MPKDITRLSLTFRVECDETREGYRSAVLSEAPPTEEEGWSTPAEWSGNPNYQLSWLSFHPDTRFEDAVRCGLTADLEEVESVFIERAFAMAKKWAAEHDYEWV
jgi:hypothetical protein